MHWKCDDRSTELGLGSPTCSLLSNDLRAVADSGERVCGASLCIYVRSSLQHQQVKSPRSKSCCLGNSVADSIVLYRPLSSSDSIVYRPYSRAPARNSPYSSVSIRFLSVD